MFAILFVGVLIGLVAKSVADADLWGHIRFGQDILASRSVVALDPYSFTTDQAWMNHEWLAEIAMATAYDYGGIPGLLSLSSGAAALILLLAARVLVKSGVGEPATVGLLAVLFVGLGGQLSGVRPQLFSAVLFVVLLTMLRSAECGTPRRLVWIAPLFSTWANLHGGWIVGLGYSAYGRFLLLPGAEFLSGGEVLRRSWAS